MVMVRFGDAFEVSRFPAFPGGRIEAYDYRYYTTKVSRFRGWKTQWNIQRVNVP